MTTYKCYARCLPAREVLDNSYLPTILTVQETASEVVREAYQYVKAYVIRECEAFRQPRTIDRKFLKVVIKVICEQSARGRQPDENLRRELSEFYRLEYSRVQKIRLQAPPKDILDAEIVQMVTAINNHIETHFYTYVKRLAEAHIGRKVDDYYRKRKKLVKDLYYHTYTSEEEFHSIVDAFAPFIVKARETRCSDPQKCLPILFRINRELQVRGKRPLCLIPTRSSLIPGSITLHRTICKDSFKNEKMWNDITLRVEELFIIKNGYNFTSLRTNGVSCSLIFTSKKKVVKIEEQYIDQLSYSERKSLRKHNIVGADPNKGNLLMMTDSHGNEFRYTNNQRRRESGSGRYRKLTRKREKEVISPLPQDKGMKLNENIHLLSYFNERTTHLDEFLLFVEQKNLFAQRFGEHYRQAWYRKFRFNSFINSKRSKDKFLQKFTQIHGPPQSTVLCVGDWEQRQGISFGKEPTMGKGMRNWFRGAGYQVYLVDEYNTSRTCNKCHKKVEYNFTKRSDPRPWLTKPTQRVWGLTRCTNSTCRTIHNRDVNSSKNIWKVAKSHILSRPLPSCFERGFQANATHDDGTPLVPITETRVGLT
jgi:Putative transposase DNA-binding domain